ncbi:disease resistance protein L6-like [Rhodamnia argentea]|uniref:ADP-ribosyl cyclase/cyclic ADP-ribose hydrolase n=1 Tax=Rhodamnia argentea TaxID=178133 RepID=A0ABM3HBU3_9MYRT|nr:disease resistance protein L6-like [Rhodamnia argentea]
MDRLIFGHSFAEVVALILLPGIAFYFLNKKKSSVRGDAEDFNTDTSASSTTPMGTNSGGSSSTPTETDDGASSSLTPSSGDSYEVFLSFSGRDTRYGFTDHLYHGLVDARIHTFRDNEELRRGKKIGDDLFTAIKNSKILIPILSMNYGTSSWCLNELVQIMECKKNNEETIVLPIFYKVEPSDVGHLLGSFGDEFRKREKRLCKRKGFDSTILTKWKEALEEVSSLKGHNAAG